MGRQDGLFQGAWRDQMRNRGSSCNGATRVSWFSSLTKLDRLPRLSCRLATQAVLIANFPEFWPARKLRPQSFGSRRRLDDLKLNLEEWTRPAALRLERAANRRRDLPRGKCALDFTTRWAAHEDQGNIARYSRLRTSVGPVVRICYCKISRIREG